MLLAKRVFLLTIISLLIMLSLSAGSLYALENTETAAEEVSFRMAPISRDFLEQVKGSDSDLFILALSDEYPLGYMPAPQVRDDEESSFLLGYSGQPASFDLRDTGRLTPIRHQCKFSSCWAFASYSSLESYLMPTRAYDFSENNLMQLHGFDASPEDGGNEYISMAYLARWSGPVSEADDPYPNFPANPNLDPLLHIQQVEFIPRDAGQIKQTLLDNGALYSAMNWNYNPLYFNEVTSAYYYNGGEKLNHAITIVGWDDNYSKDNFKITPPGDGAWIVRNSWGTSWGNEGYFHMSYHDTHAGARVVAFHNAEPTNNYSRIYQHDPLGWVRSYGAVGIDTIHAANIFNALADEDLAAVSTYAVRPGKNFRVQIYSGVEAGKPNSGKLMLTQSGTLNRAGYHTIKLDKVVPLKKGELFSVAIRYNTPSYDYPLPIECIVNNYSSAAQANPGESFISSDGVSWGDLTTRVPNANACIKAFTVEKTISQGALKVTIIPEGARVSGAEWSINGSDSWHNSGDELALDAGTYTITFRDLAHWHKPGDLDLKVTEGETKNYTAVYSKKSYNIVLSADPNHSGTVSGSDSYEYDEEITVVAKAAAGFSFVNWTEGGTVVSEKTDYTFTVAQDRTLVANFETTDSGSDYDSDSDSDTDSGPDSDSDPDSDSSSDSDSDSDPGSDSNPDPDSNVPVYIYYETSDGDLVRADFQKAENDLFRPNPDRRLINAIREKLREAFQNRKAIYVVAESKRVIDYLKAAAEGLTYFEAYNNPDYRAAPQYPTKELIINLITGREEEKGL